MRVIFGDTAYGRKALPEFVLSTLGFRIEVVRKAKDAIGFEVIDKRWIVERTIAWLGRNRRHTKDSERNPETSETLIQNTRIHLMLKRLANTTS
ncbi:MAG: transposase [Planctomycetaceae bacterium]|nr:transposase [Planctomycetaceae bacterium]